MLAETMIELPVRVIDGTDDLSETRLEALGYVFHGTVPEPQSRRRAVRATTNLLHFSRCPKLDRAEADPDHLWFRTIRVAKEYLDEHIGAGRWRWCKHCQREITQRLINE